MGDAAYILVEGEVSVLVNDGTRAVARIGSNQVVGEIAVLGDVPRTASVRAETPLVALRISKEAFLGLLHDFPQVAVSMMRVVAQRLENTTAPAAPCPCRRERSRRGVIGFGLLSAGSSSRTTTHLTPALSPLKGGEGAIERFGGKSFSAPLQGGEGFRMRWVLPLTQALPIFASMAFLAAGIIPSAAQSQSLATAPPITAALATLDREIVGDIQAHGFPGLSIAVSHGDEILWHHDYGAADLARGDKVGSATRFRLGSISKLFTALAILQLRDAGKLDLDDRVTKTLPWFHLAGDAHPAITIRELLLHLSGLPADAPGVSWTDRVMPSREQVIQGLPEVEPAIPAESTWKYSNLGYVLLGFVIEAASAESYAGYVETPVLKPLGMAETLVEPEPQTPRLAIGYGARGPDGVRDPRAFLPMGAMTPAAGITSTSLDMARLAAWALLDGDGPVLSARSRREMLRSQADFSDFSGGQGPRLGDPAGR
ncbi:MAG: serine hydrolase [Aliidongia sp.]